MTEFSRRTLFAGAAALAATSGLPLATPARAATGGAGTGVYRYKIGDIEVVQLMDGARTFPIPDQFVANQSKDKAIQAAAAAYMPEGKVTVPFCPILLTTGGKRVLIDTGNGLGAFAATKGAVGQTRDNMMAAGVDPKQVDIVIISHFHGDHMNGLKAADGSPVYPNAEIKVPAAEATFWADESNASKVNAYNKGNFANVKKAFAGLKTAPYEAGKEVAPGVTSVATPGHTPGHSSFVVASGSKKLLVQSDVTNIPSFFLKNPNWHVMFDVDGAMAAQTRHKFYDMAAAEKAPVVGFHFPYPCVGYVEKAASGYQLIPVAWDPNG